MSVVDSAAWGSGAAQRYGTAGGKRRFSVVVVDDDPRVCALHARVVKAHPALHLAGVARSGRGAVAAALNLRPDLVLLDVYLPDITGTEVLRRLRAARPCDLDVIAVTAAREVDTVRAAMAGGVLHYLIKPFALPELTARLDMYVAMRRALASNPTRPMSQGAVDRMLGTGATAELARAGATTPKGIAARTLERVCEAMARVEGDASADQIAQGVGMSRVAARRYLEYLVGTGAIAAQPRYGAPGRPETRYRWVGG